MADSRFQGLPTAVPGKTTTHRSPPHHFGKNLVPEQSALEIYPNRYDTRSMPFSLGMRSVMLPKEVVKVHS